MPTLIWIASALTAGVLARVVMKSRGFGFTGDAVLGVLGSVSGAWLLRLVGGEISPGNVAHVAIAFVGAMFLVAAGRLALRVAQGASQLSEATVGAALPDIESHFSTATLYSASRLSSAASFFASVVFSTALREVSAATRSTLASALALV